MRAAATVTWWRRLTPLRLAMLVPWIGLVIGAARPISDNSLLWHIRAGTAQLGLGEVLRADPFSFTMKGSAWRTQSWLLELGYGLLERWTGGLSWVPVMLVVVASAVFVLVGLSTHRHTKNLYATSFVMAGLTWLALSFQVPRPVLFSFLFLVLLVAALDWDLRWTVPLIFWVWASVHGSWIVGLGYVLLEALSSRRSRSDTSKVLLISVGTVSLTAHGIGVWEILIAFFRNRDALRLMSEWRIPDIISLAAVPYAVALVALLVAASRGRLVPRQLWIVAPFALFGLTAGRSLMPAALVLAPWAGTAVSSRFEGELPGARGFESALNLLLGLVLLVAPFSAYLAFHPVLDRQAFPVTAARYLGPERVWHDDGAGGYLIYSDWPQRLVYVDDRAELYGADLMSELVRSREGVPVWADVFGRYGIRQAVVRSSSDLNRALVDAGWHLLYQDPDWRVWHQPLP